MHSWWNVTCQTCLIFQVSWGIQMRLAFALQWHSTECLPSRVQTVHKTAGGSVWELFTVLGAGSDCHHTFSIKGWTAFYECSPAGAIYGISSRGWMEADNVIPPSSSSPPTHRSCAVVRGWPLLPSVSSSDSYCKGKGVHLYCFPAHTTYILQPLD